MLNECVDCKKAIVKLPFSPQTSKRTVAKIVRRNIYCLNTSLEGETFKRCKAARRLTNH